MVHIRSYRCINDGRENGSSRMTIAVKMKDLKMATSGSSPNGTSRSNFSKSNRNARETGTLSILEETNSGNLRRSSRLEAKKKLSQKKNMEDQSQHLSWPSKHKRKRQYAKSKRGYLLHQKPVLRDARSPAVRMDEQNSSKGHVTNVSTNVAYGENQNTLKDRENCAQFDKSANKILESSISGLHESSMEMLEKKGYMSQHLSWPSTHKRKRQNAKSNREYLLHQKRVLGEARSPAIRVDEENAFKGHVTNVNTNVAYEENHNALEDRENQAQLDKGASKVLKSSIFGSHEFSLKMLEKQGHMTDVNPPDSFSDDIKMDGKNASEGHVNDVNRSAAYEENCNAPTSSSKDVTIDRENAFEVLVAVVNTYAVNDKKFSAHAPFPEKNEKKNSPHSKVSNRTSSSNSTRKKNEKMQVSTESQKKNKKDPSQHASKASKKQKRLDAKSYLEHFLHLKQVLEEAKPDVAVNMDGENAFEQHVANVNTSVPYEENCNALEDKENQTHLNEGADKVLLSSTPGSHEPSMAILEKEGLETDVDSLSFSEDVKMDKANALEGHVDGVNAHIAYEENCNALASFSNDVRINKENASEEHIVHVNASMAHSNKGANEVLQSSTPVLHEPFMRILENERLETIADPFISFSEHDVRIDEKNASEENVVDVNAYVANEQNDCAFASLSEIIRIDEENISKGHVANVDTFVAHSDESASDVLQSSILRSQEPSMRRLGKEKLAIDVGPPSPFLEELSVNEHGMTEHAEMENISSSVPLQPATASQHLGDVPIEVNADKATIISANSNPHLEVPSSTAQSGQATLPACKEIERQTYLIRPSSHRILAPLAQPPAEVEQPVMSGVAHTQPSSSLSGMQPSTSMSNVHAERTCPKNQSQLAYHTVHGSTQFSQIFQAGLMMSNNPLADDGPLKNELHRLRLNNDFLNREHEQKKLRLQTECHQKMENIRRTYELVLQEEYSTCLQKRRVLNILYEKVLANQSLAHEFRAKFIFPEVEQSVVMGVANTQLSLPLSGMQPSTSVSNVHAERICPNTQSQVAYPISGQFSQIFQAGSMMYNHPPVDDGPMKNELHRLRINNEFLNREHEQKKLRLQTECNQKMENIRRTYELLLQEECSIYFQKRKALNELYEKVLPSQSLIEYFRAKFIAAPMSEGTVLSPPLRPPPQVFQHVSMRSSSMAPTASPMPTSLTLSRPRIQPLQVSGHSSSSWMVQSSLSVLPSNFVRPTASPFVYGVRNDQAHATAPYVQHSRPVPPIYRETANLARHSMVPTNQQVAELAVAVRTNVPIFTLTGWSSHTILPTTLPQSSSQAIPVAAVPLSSHLRPPIFRK